MSAAGTPSGGSYFKAHRFRSCGDEDFWEM